MVASCIPCKWKSATLPLDERYPTISGTFVTKSREIEICSWLGPHFHLQDIIHERRIA